MGQGTKLGGRTKGTPNKLTKQLQDWFEKDLIGADAKYQHPVLGLLAIGYNVEAPYAVRAKALEAASKALVPTKIELTGADGEPLFDTTPALNIALALIQQPTPQTLPPASVDVTTLLEHVTDGGTAQPGAVGTRTSETVAA